MARVSPVLRVTRCTPLDGGCAEHKQKEGEQKSRASPLTTGDAAGRSELQKAAKKWRESPLHYESHGVQRTAAWRLRGAPTKKREKKRRASPLNSSDAAGRSERSTRRASDSVISQGFTPSPLGSAPSPMGPTPSPLWQHRRNPRHRLWGQCHRLRDGAIASGPSPPAGSARSPQGAAPSLLRPAPSLLGPAATNKTCK